MAGKNDKLRELATALHASVEQAGTPEFSGGTATVDTKGNLQQPDASNQPGEFSAGTVTLEPGQVDPNPNEAIVGTRPESDAGKGKTETAPQTRERGADGKYIGQAPDAAPTAKEKAEEQASGAAESAAEAMLDPFAEYEDVEYEDSDLGTKYTVKAKKAEAKAVKDGYRRRSDWNREIGHVRKASPVLEKLVATGQLNQILPLLQRALEDQEYGQFVVDAFNRRVAGKPLMEQAIAQAAAAGAAQVQNQGFEIPGYTADANSDPFMDEYLNARISPLAQKLQAQEQFISTIQQQQQQQAAAAQAQQQRLAEFQESHNELSRLYPEDFSGNIDRDSQNLQNVAKYAQTSNYVNTYGLRAAMRLAAMELRQARAESASPAAAAINAIDQATLKAATAQAGAARTVGSGTAQTAPPKPSGPPVTVKVATTHPNGKRKTPEEFMRDTLAANPHLAQAVAS